MRPTKKYLEERFAHFNTLCFGGKLPRVPICLSRAHSFMGQLRFQRRCGLFGDGEPRNISLAISTSYDLSEAQLDDVLIHEMIHLHILVNDLDDTSSHGRTFRAIMADINTRYGRHVAISHKATKQEKVQDDRIRACIVGLVSLDDGRCGIIIPQLPYVRRLSSQLNQSSMVSSVKWYATTHPFFNRFRRSRTLKVNLLKGDDLEQCLELLKGADNGTGARQDNKSGTDHA